MIIEYNGIPLFKDHPIQSARGGLFDEHCRETSRQLDVCTEWVADRVVEQMVEYWTHSPFRICCGAERTKTRPGERIAYP
jgi:hypothetical protein